jgi:gliding motility-associated-like protein
MEIYDRWGNHIFSSEDTNAKWNGTFKNQAAQHSVYTFFIEYQDLKRNILRTKKGDVQLVR